MRTLICLPLSAFLLSFACGKPDSPRAAARPRPAAGNVVTFFNKETLSIKAPSATPSEDKKYIVTEVATEYPSSIIVKTEDNKDVVCTPTANDWSVQFAGNDVKATSQKKQSGLNYELRVYYPANWEPLGSAFSWRDGGHASSVTVTKANGTGCNQPIQYPHLVILQYGAQASPAIDLGDEDPPSEVIGSSLKLRAGKGFHWEQVPLLKERYIVVPNTGGSLARRRLKVIRLYCPYGECVSQDFRVTGSSPVDIKISPHDVDLKVVAGVKSAIARKGTFTPMAENGVAGAVLVHSDSATIKSIEMALGGHKVVLPENVEPYFYGIDITTERY